MDRRRFLRTALLTAVLTVLLMVSVMSVVAVAILDDVRFSVRRTANVEFQSQAQWYAAGVENLARGQIAGLLAAGQGGEPLLPRGGETVAVECARRLLALRAAFVPRR